MSMLLGFAPFVAFALLQNLLGVVGALAAAAAVSAVVLLRDALTPGRTVKLLEIGSLLLFGGLATYAFLTGTSWPVLGVRLRVDAALMLIVLVSLAVRRPFTLAYARERVAPEFWATPEFLRVNNVITAAWALAFAAMVLADLLMLYVPGVPLWVGVVVTVAALLGAIRFTVAYPARVRAARNAASAK